MKLGARGGNSLHAPESCRIALLSAFTSGADVLEFMVQLTRDGHVVLSRDGTVRLPTGERRQILAMNFADLKTFDLSVGFKPRGANDYVYRHNPKQPVTIESLPEICQILPSGLPLIIGLGRESSIGTGRRDDFVSAVVDALLRNGLEHNVIVYSSDPDNLRLVRRLHPHIRIAAFSQELDPQRAVDLMVQLDADGLVVSLPDLLTPDGQLTPVGLELQRLHDEKNPGLACLVYRADSGDVLSPAEYVRLADLPFVWCFLTGSMLDVPEVAGGACEWLNEPFAGKEINTDLWAFGYAKANGYCHVFQDDGVHIKIAPYQGPLSKDSSDSVQQQLNTLEERTWYALKDWPFYSGGAVGFRQGIEGPFVAEVDYSVAQVGQATTLEMAAINVDPGAHHAPWNSDGTPRLPVTFRDKDSFFDPHGAPPYVGAEHDEDDGYRINWNFGTEYDNNRYGPDVGNGKALSGRLRLERRGTYFSAYYRNGLDAPDWVCVGSVRNESINSRIFLRCAGKRWRQELPDDPNKFYPILSNEFIFRNLVIYKHAASEELPRPAAAIQQTAPGLS